MLRAIGLCAVGVLITFAACSGKHRPFADTPIEGFGGSSPGTGAPAMEQGTEVAGPGRAATRGEPLGGAPVDTLSPLEDAVQSGGSLGCEGDAGICVEPDGGAAPPECVPTGPRDCTSDLDNDCDGQPDNVLDDVCLCVPGTSGPCDEHPGLDGRGECRAGLRICLLDEVALTTAWSQCEGAVGPGDEDSCEPGDDTDCDGTPNEGCSCVDGATQPCGSNTNTGPCQIGTSTCVDGRFGECIGAVAPASGDSCASRNDDSNCNGIPFDGCACVNGETQSCGMTDTGVCQLGMRTCVNGAFGQCVGQVNPRSRDCRSQQDNDCDGRPDNTIDNVCQCSIGSTRACEQHPGQDGVGQCRAGSQQCLAGQNNSSSVFGQCNGSVDPAPQDSCANVNDANCNGISNGGCECIAGQGNGPCSGDPNNSRCNAQGQCVPCQSNADCSLVSGGRSTCVGGECVGPFGCSDPPPPAGPEPPFEQGGLAGSPNGPPPTTGGVIANGRYTVTSVTFYAQIPIAVPGEVIDFRDGSYRRNVTFYNPGTGLVSGGFTEAGTYETNAIGLLFIDGITCSLGNSARSEVWEFSVMGSQLVISDGLPGHRLYQRTPIPD